jgi:hypothetical protein
MSGLTGLVAGSNTLQFRAYACVNDGFATSATYTFTVDNTAPTATIARTSSSPASVGPMVFAVTITEANTYTFNPATGLTYTNGAYASHTVAGNVYTVNVTPTSPSPLTGHTVTVAIKASAIVDCAGNASTVTPSATGQFDNVAPTLAITSPTSVGAYGPNSTFAFNTNEALVAGTVQYSWNGIIWYNIAGAVASNYSADLSTLTGAPTVDGTYTLRVRGNDAAGNTGNAQVTFVIDVTPPAWCAGTPSRDFDVPVTKTKATLIAGINETGTIYYVVQLSSATPPTLATVWAGSTFVPAVSTCGGNTEDYHLEITGLSPSTEYTVYLIAEDQYGNKQTALESVTFETQEVPAPHSNLYVAGRTLSTITLKWTKANNSNVFIVAKEGSAVNFDEDMLDGTAPSASSDFKSGYELGSGNFVVYSGNENMITVRALNPNTVYHFALYAVSTDGNLIYNTDQKLTISQRTLRKEGIEDDVAAGTPSLSIRNLRPNPATTDLTFDLEVFDQTDIRVEVINAAGQVVAIPIVNAQYGDGIYPIQIVLDSEKVASGAYYLKVTANGKEIAIAPFSVVR